MQAPIFHVLTLLESRPETPDLWHLRLGQASAGYFASHTLPGQYVQVRIPDFDKPGFFAVASRPGLPFIDLLLKRGAPLVEALCALSKGARVEVSAPLGKGYPIHCAHGVDLLLIGVGSALAPLRAVVQTVLLERATFGAVRLYYGARDAGHVPYKSDIEAWRAQGVEFQSAWSNLLSTGQLEGETVQALLERLRPALKNDSCVFVCGMKEMVADVTRVCGTLGVPPERVYQNF